MNIKQLAFACAATVAQCFNVGTLQLPTQTFDPEHPQVRQLLAQALGKHAIDVQPLKANVGLNGGVWVVSDPHRQWDDMIVKLRPVEHDFYPSHPPEAIHFPNIYREHPGLATDPDVIFPSNILGCIGPSGTKHSDLIVMKKAPGMTLAFFLAEKFMQGPQGRTELMTVFESIGQHLRRFHEKYDNKQHSDFQASNIMVDGSNGNKITFIDLGGMGLPIGDDDISHLKECLTMLASAYPGIMELGKRHFETGYYHGQSQGRFAPQQQQAAQAQAAQAQAAQAQAAQAQAAQAQAAQAQAAQAQAAQARAAQAQAAQAQAAQAAQAQAEAHARAQVEAQAEAQARAWAQAQAQAHAQAQAQAQSTPEGAFKVSMPRAQGDKLGLLLVNRNQTAVIKAVKPGVVAQWNARNPNLQVEPGQRVLEVNGFRGSYLEMLQACKGAYMVGDAVDVWSHSRGWWFSDGRVMMVSGEGVAVNFDGGRLTKIIAHDSVEMRKKESTLEMLIESVQNTMAEFHVRVSKSFGKKLGLKLVNRNGVAVVKGVHDGLISDWNAQNSREQVKIGDRILEVNQRRDGYQEVIELCRESDVLDLLVQREIIPVNQ